MKVKILAVNWRSRTSPKNFAAGTSKLNCQWFRLLHRRKLKQLLLTVALFAPLLLAVPANTDSNLAIAPLLPNRQLAGATLQAALGDKSGTIADLEQAAKLYKEQGKMFDYKRAQEILKQLQT